MNFSDIFTNRQIATSIWIFILFIYFLFDKKIRTSFFVVLKSFFNLKILIPIFSMIIYVSACIKLLAMVNLWSIVLLKDSILWFCLTALVITTNALTSNRNDNFIKQAIVNSIKVVVFIQFIANSYSFPLIVEFIIFPIIAIIAMLEVVSKNENKYLVVNKIMNTLLIIIGILILANSIYLIFNDFNKFGNYYTLKKFLLPIILTILYTPFLFFIRILSNYEQIFIRLKIDNNKLLRCAKIKLILFCKFNLRKQRNVMKKIFIDSCDIKTKEDIDVMIISYSIIK